MQIEYTNFDGDWDAQCPFCGKPQRDHQVDLGELEEVRFIHRQPCPEEQRQIIKRAIIQANTVRVVVTLYEISVYIWSRIPFKEEARLIYKILSRSYVGVRGILYYWLVYRRRK